MLFPAASSMRAATIPVPVSRRLFKRLDTAGNPAPRRTDRLAVVAGKTDNGVVCEVVAEQEAAIASAARQRITASPADGDGGVAAAAIRVESNTGI
jgi:hypothetical protein